MSASAKKKAPPHSLNPASHALCQLSPLHQGFRAFSVLVLSAWIVFAGDALTPMLDCRLDARVALREIGRAHHRVEADVGM